MRERTVGLAPAFVANLGAGQLKVRARRPFMADGYVARIGTGECLGGQRCSPGESECGQDRCEE